MTTRKNAGKPGDLLEIVADIAYTAGMFRHYSGDSRADMHSYISWAGEFAASFTQEQEDAGEYMERVEAFADAKLREAGNCGGSGPRAEDREPCDECNGTRYPVERHEKHCSLYKATEKGGTE